ncbi:MULTISPECIES: D-amino-acid transaminase [Enterococcus]|jgi:D-alanine transaminase|uniref:D-amino-acid transaminase n=1 Tax=Enterococcus TaxID=1350 RepID=UPI0002720A28|nr:MULTISPECIES: D-amino-acid transaminase [Enterococcus]AMG50547.1 D-amino-acid transaminase [Enterococcus gallinarum]EPH66085.1 D-amino-acid transaminase [Enterococcus faecium 13.SD.W.09]OTO94926.1 D-amino-acid transaminase [Enterococcus faecium]EJF48231.1 D-amino-acid transaminase [Enterococcus sp. C1]MBE9897017.1 D-amino-acid transaminase [Enterococcus casseliflavus]
MKVLWNDQIVDREAVKIDIEDRGYQYGDGIYEVIRIYNGRCFMLGEHMTRLESSAQKIKLTLPYTIPQLTENLKLLVKTEGITEGEIYLQITRGIASPRNHEFPSAGAVKGVVTANVIPFERPLEMQHAGLSATVLPDERWLHCDIKSLSLLGNLLALDQAIEAGFDDALLQRDGCFTEASASNLWFVIDGIVYTHPDGRLVLPGITKMKVLQLCQQLEIPYREEPVPVEALNNAQECFLTNSVWEIVPIVKVDGKSVGNGTLGSITKRLQAAYIAATKSMCES